MSSPSAADEAVIARARDAMTAVRAAEHAVLVALGELAESSAWEATGHRSVARFVEELWRVDPAHATRWVRHAERLLPMVALSGDPLEPRMPAAARATAEGAIGDEHLRVLVRAHGLVGRISGLSPERVAEAEELLAESARSLPPCALERVVTRLLSTLDQDGAAPEDDPERPDEWLVTRRRDGTVAFTGRIHGVADVELLMETLDALAGPAGADDERSLGERRAEVLLELCAQAHAPQGIAEDAEDTPHDEAGGTEPRQGTLRLVPDDEEFPAEPDDGVGPAPEADPDGTATATAPDEAGPGDGSGTPTGSVADDDRGPTAASPGAGAAGRRRPGTHRAPRLPVPARAQIAVTIPLEWLRRQVGHGEFDTGRLLDPATARRMACDANTLPVVLGSRGEPIELGRSAYVVTEALRRLLIMRDRGCAHPGCTRRPRRCHAHHIRHWAEGGPTEPDNLVLLCRYHHQLVHHGGWEIRMVEGRPWFVPPRWTDPRRTPIPGGPALPDTARAA